MHTPRELDRTAVMRQFDRRAATLARGDFILREVERRMLERLDLVRLQPQRILDVGSGLGDGIRRLRTRYPQAWALGADLSVELSRRACGIDRPSLGERARSLAQRLAARLGAVEPSPAGLASYVAADAHRLPLPASCVDLVWSNLAFHWFDDPPAAIAEWYRVVRPGGLLMFSAFGVDTLRELRALGFDTIGFPDMHDIGDALVHAGFAEPVMDTERIVVTWTDARRMLAELRSLGGNPIRRRHAGLVTPRRLDAALRAADAGLRRRPGPAGPSGPVDEAPLSVTFEIIHGHAWCGATKRLPDGYAPIAFRPPYAGRGTRR